VKVAGKEKVEILDLCVKPSLGSSSARLIGELEPRFFFVEPSSNIISRLVVKLGSSSSSTKN
jgi:hypothetical protein